MSDAVTDDASNHWKAWAFSLIRAISIKCSQPKYDSKNKNNKGKPMKTNATKIKTANKNINLGIVKEIGSFLSSWLP